MEISICAGVGDVDMAGGVNLDRGVSEAGGINGALHPEACFIGDISEASAIPVTDMPVAVFIEAEGGIETGDIGGGGDDLFIPLLEGVGGFRRENEAGAQESYSQYDFKE